MRLCLQWLNSYYSYVENRNNVIFVVIEVLTADKEIKIMDISMRLANSYFGMLKSLSNETKLHLIKLLTDSILTNKDKNIAVENDKLEEFFGIWSDDAETDNMIKIIRDSKVSGKTRNIVSLDE